MLHISKQKGDCMMDSPGKRRTSQLTRAECADLIEFIFSWSALHDFPIPDKSQIEYIDQDTGEVYA